jgi:hypothetical protein
MGGNDSQATFSLRLDSDAGAKSTSEAAALEGLRQKIAGSSESIKQMGSALRSLRGNTDEVKAAKEELKAKIVSERDSVSAANIALLKQGTTYEKIAGDARKLAAEKKSLDDKMKGASLDKAKAKADALGSAIKLAGGPVDSLIGGLGSLEEVVGGAGGAMGALALGATAAVAGIAAVTVSVLGLTASLLRFILVSGDNLRNQELVREAFTGNAKSAQNLGDHVDQLAGKVVTGREELNKLAVGLTRTRLSGGAIVDTFNLVGQASAAMGDDVGKALQDIVTRGQVVKRFQINPQELVGKGVSFQDVAGELAKQMHVGVKQAQAALFEGRVKLDDGAKALRTAVEKRFGEINARKLLSIDGITKRFHENLEGLAKGVNLEPILKGVDELAKLFDQSTVSGATLKALVTFVGDAVGPVFTAALPLVKAFFKGTIIGALDVGIAFLKLRNWIRGAVGDSNLFSGLVTAQDAMRAAKVAIYGVVAAVVILGAAIALATAPIWVSALALYGLYKAGSAVWEKLKSIPWGELGTSIVDGLIGGLKSGAAKLTSAVSSLATSVKDAFTGALQIHSPSKVFAQFGMHTAGGYAQGVRQGTPRARAAVVSMGRPSTTERASLFAGIGARGDTRSAGALDARLESPRSAALAAVARAGSSGAGGVNVNLGGITIQGGGEHAPEIAKRANDPGFRAGLTKFAEEFLLGRGIPTQAPVAP